MKVSVRETYVWKNVELVPSPGHDPEFVIELEQPDVMAILDVQTKFEALQQRLRPLYEAAFEAKKQKEEEKKAAEEMADPMISALPSGARAASEEV